MRKWLPLGSAIGGVIRGSVALGASRTASTAVSVALILVAVLALSACGGGSEPPAAETATVEHMLPSGLKVSDHPKVMKWLNGRLDACTPAYDSALESDESWRALDFLGQCMADDTRNACEHWVDKAHFDKCDERLQMLTSDALTDENGYRTPEQMRLPSGLTVGDYPEALAWVAKRRKTCAGSASLEKCMTDDERYGVTPTCGHWFGRVDPGGVDPEDRDYADCVEDMRHFVKEMLENVEGTRYFVRALAKGS